MCRVEIIDVKKFEDDRKIGNSFTLSVEGQADENAGFYWYERTDRTYDAGPERDNEWEDLFAKYRYCTDDTNLFAEAGNALEEVEKGKKTLQFTITDRPSVQKELGSRVLDFLLLVRMTKDKGYAAACRQKLDGNGTLTFQKTDCVEVTDAQVEQIRSVCLGYGAQTDKSLSGCPDNTTLDAIISCYGLGKLNEVQMS